MVTDQTLIFYTTFASVAILGYWLTRMLVNRGETDKLRDRLSRPAQAPSDPLMMGGGGGGGSSAFGGFGGGGGAVAATSVGTTMELTSVDAAAQRRRQATRAGIVKLFQRVGLAAAQPFMPKSREKQSGLRQNLGRAGIYSPSAAKVLTGAKVIFLGAGLFCGYLAGITFGYLFLLVSLGGIVGYLAPVIWLKMAIKKNQKLLTYGLADALDLMVVCVEAGLTVDAAMQRVGQEMMLAHPSISREFGICHMETRVGLSRAESLRNMATRTTSPAIQSLSSMLIQADRFGTSIAQALRIHAETLRTNRQHAAEEQAAKASVKMSFPLVLFIFPATFIVLAGPTVVELMNSEIMK